MRSPLMLAAGHAKTVETVAEFARSNALSEITAGSFTLEPREGNPGRTFAEHPHLPRSWLNALGMPNGGLPYLQEHISALLNAAGEKRLRVSIAPIKPGDLGQLVQFLRPHANRLTVEVNLGCPNVWDGGKNKPLICHDTVATREALREVSAACSGTGLVVAVKLSPLLPSMHEQVIRLCYEHTAVRELVTMNTRPGVPTEGVLDVPLAGLSGEAIAEEALEQTRHTAHWMGTYWSDRRRLISVGAINCSRRVEERLAVDGVHALQVGTHAFVHDPRVFEELLLGMSESVATT